MFSLSMCAEPSDIRTPPAPGWKLKTAFTLFSFVQLKKQTAFFRRRQPVPVPWKLLPTIQCDALYKQAQQPPGLLTVYPLKGLGSSN